MKSSSPHSRPFRPLDIEAVQTQLIWANHREVEPQFQHFLFQVKDETVCWFVSSGGLQISGSDSEIEVQPQTWVFLGEEDAEMTFESGTRIFSIRFRFLYRGGGKIFPHGKPLPFGTETDPDLRRVADDLVDTLSPWQSAETLLIGRERMPLDVNLKVEGAFLNWLAAYTRMMPGLGVQMREPKARDERVNRAVGLIDAHPMREPFDEGALSVACGLSTSQLRRLFQKEVGTSPFAYYDRRRSELARHALRETSMPIKEMAYELGFSSSAHFSNWFKTRSGESPREFRTRGP
jgi:AraC-like DNA-binding protein